MTDPDHPEIYRSQAQQYDALVRYEDYRGNIRRALTDLCPWSGRTAVETGAGTGRLTFLLAGPTTAYTICDHSPAMLAVASEKRAGGGFAIAAAAPTLVGGFVRAQAAEAAGDAKDLFRVAIAGVIAVQEATPLWAILLSIGVMYWVAGFDLLYSLQDMEYDKANGLFSIPSR